MMRSLWAMLPSVSSVLVVVIDWMRMGFSPPISNLPMCKTQVWRRL